MPTPMRQTHSAAVVGATVILVCVYMLTQPPAPDVQKHDASSTRVTEGRWVAALANMPELLRRVPKRHRETCRRVLTASSEVGFSQAWQDWILYRNFFAGQRRGIYVDIGTNDAIAISNTAFFDLCLGWRGVCFEPAAAHHAKIRRERTCVLSPHCVLGRAGSVNMTGVGTGGARVVASTDARGQQQQGRGVQSHTCVELAGELRRLGFRSNETIDLLSIDVEGSEPAVLRCLPWQRLHIRFVLIETDKASSLAEIDLFFANHGYANVATLLLDTGSRYGAGAPSYGRLLDNLYMRMEGGPLVTPKGRPSCSAEDRKRNPLCAPHARWLRDGTPSADHPWGACDAARGAHRRHVGRGAEKRKQKAVWSAVNERADGRIGVDADNLVP